MKIELDIPDEKWDWLVAQGGDPTENLMAKVNEYLDACGRDAQATLEAKVAKRLAEMTEAEKLALVDGN